MYEIYSRLNINKIKCSMYKVIVCSLIYVYSLFYIRLYIASIIQINWNVLYPNSIHIGFQLIPAQRLKS